MTMDAPSPDATTPAASRTYSDGHPLDQVHYREYKLILRATRFTSAQSFADFSRLVRHAAEELDVALFREERPEPQIREVLFFDTPACHLYNGKFILRQRTTYRNGWPVDEHEVVLKFRHPDLGYRGGGGRAANRPARLPHQVQGRAAAPARGPRRYPEPLLPQLHPELTRRALRDRPLQEVAALFPALRRLGGAAGHADPARQRHGHRGGPGRHRRGALRARASSQGQRRRLARPGPADAARRRVRLPVQVRALRGAAPQGQEALGGVLPHACSSRRATGCSSTRPRPAWCMARARAP